MTLDNQSNVIRILSVDPGAERAGWAILDYDPTSDIILRYVDSGILRYPRGEVEFQAYRVLLEKRFWWTFGSIVQCYEPSVIVNETLPAVSNGSNFVVATQSYLVNTVVTTLHNIATFYNIPTYQISARTVQSLVAVKGKTKKITKQQVRNGVIQYIPALKEKAKEWTKLGHWDESDGCAIGIAFYLTQLAKK